MTPIDFEGIAPTNELEAAREQLHSNFAQVESLIPDLDPQVWRAIAEMVGMAHLLGLREANAQTQADLNEVIVKAEGRAK